MIRTLSTVSTDSSCSSNEHHSLERPPPPVTRTRRFTLHSIATRLSDSKKNLFEHIHHHHHRHHPQQHLTNFRQRAQSFLATSFTDHLADFNIASDRRNSATGVHLENSTSSCYFFFKFFFRRELIILCFSLDHQCRRNLSAY